MDALSHLLQLARVQVLLDLRCLLGGRFALPHAKQVREAAFHFVLSGQCRLQVAGRELCLRSGDFVLLPLGSAHLVQQADGAGDLAGDPAMEPELQQGAALALKTNVNAGQQASVELLCGRYRYASGAGELLARWLPEVLHIHLPDNASESGLQALLHWLRAEAAGSAQPGAHAVIDGLGQALLALALRAARQVELPAGLLPLLADERLGASVRAVLDAPQQPWTIEKLAASVAMSRATYARHFQALAGCGVAEFVLQLRMMQACDWLGDPQRSVADVAEAVGYGSEAAFATAFKRVLGQTPARWRKADIESRSAWQGTARP